MASAREIHTKEFLRILVEPNTKSKIREVMHSRSIFVFWVSPGGNILDAKNAHHDNPPDGDRSILSDKTHKGHLRGRVAFIGTRIYVVIYGDEGNKLSRKQK